MFPLKIWKMSIPLVNYKITLISGGKIIMVQSEGNDYEAQCFVPQILNGVITLVNVVRARRCCLIAHNDSFLAHKKGVGKEPLAKSTPSTEEHQFRTPLSTQEFSHNTLALSRISNIPVRSINLNESSFTPEVPRCAPNMNTSVMDPPATPNSTGKRILNSFHLSMTNSSILPALPSISSGDVSIGSVLSMDSFSNATPNVTFLKRKVMQRGIQWRNCKTPIRTYSKKTNNNPSHPDEYQFHYSPKFKNGQSIPTYRRNTTKGIVSKEIVSHRRFKVFIDEHTRISPDTYKQNIADTSDLKRNTEEEFLYSRNKKFFEGAQEQATVFTLPWKRNCAEALKGQFEDVLSNTIVPTKERYLVLLQGIPPFGMEEEPIVETKINEEVEVNMDTNEVIIKRKHPIYARRLF